jgi:hypothetical protein
MIRKGKSQMERKIYEKKRKFIYDFYSEFTQLMMIYFTFIKRITSSEKSNWKKIT